MSSAKRLGEDLCRLALIFEKYLQYDSYIKHHNTYFTTNLNLDGKSLTITGKTSIINIIYKQIKKEYDTDENSGELCQDMFESKIGVSKMSSKALIKCLTCECTAPKEMMRILTGMWGW